MKAVLAAGLMLVGCHSNPAAKERGGACETCHAAIAAEQESSLHARAFSDSTFQASLALEEPKEHAFCVGCHAPTSKSAGVGCTSCHSAAHTKQKVSCTGCHEFTFDQRPELVQKTVSEHAASRFASIDCAACHMPRVNGHKDHRFLAGHAPAVIANAAHVEARRVDTGVAFTIRVDAGHLFPTGDMFRRARLLVFVEEGSHIVDSAERTFGRTWGSHPNGTRTQLTDTRIREAYSETFAVTKGDRVRWQLLYERVIAMRGEQVTLASSDSIAEGVLDLANGHDR